MTENAAAAVDKTRRDAGARSRSSGARSRSSPSCARRSTRRGTRSGGSPRHAAQVRVAAVDLGTNTTRLLVADVEDGAREELHRETRITRLGEGVDARGRLLPVPIARVRNVLTDYRRTAESLGAERTLLVATSAVRDAENGEAFLGEIEWSYGFATRLLSGDEEAELTRRGVGAVAAGHAARRHRRRLDRARPRRLPHQPAAWAPSASPSDTARTSPRSRYAARELLAGARAGGAVGVAATITTLAALDLGLERTTASASTATSSRATARGHSSSGSPRCRSTSGGRCRRSSPSARRSSSPAPRSSSRSSTRTSSTAIRVERAGPARRRRARRRRAAGAGRRRRASRRLHLLLAQARGTSARRSVARSRAARPRRGAAGRRARESDADEAPALLDDRHALEIAAPRGSGRRPRARARRRA